MIYFQQVSKNSTNFVKYDLLQFKKLLRFCVHAVLVLNIIILFALLILPLVSYFLMMIFTIASMFNVHGHSFATTASSNYIFMVLQLLTSWNVYFSSFVWNIVLSMLLSEYFMSNLSEPMLFSLSTHICVARPWWVNYSLYTLWQYPHSYANGATHNFLLRPWWHNLPPLSIRYCSSVVAWRFVLSGKPGLWECSLAHVSNMTAIHRLSWWHHQMETFFALLTLCAGKITLTKASVALLWCFLWSVPEQTVE